MVQTDNMVRLVGEVKEEPKFSHKAFDEDFYRFILSCKRSSGTGDEIPVLVSNKTFDVSMIKRDMRLVIKGQLRTHNVHLDGHDKVLLDVFVTDIDETESIDMNTVHLIGHLCKKPTYRETPFGRKISDVLIATNRIGGKSSYIPLIVWGRDAKYISTFSVGTCIDIEGRVQSRNYQKFHNGKTEIKTTHEISVTKLNIESLNVG